jgi:hypothetical protein
VVGQVGEDVVGADLHPSVGDLLGLDEIHRVDALALGEEHGAGEAIEVGTSHEPHVDE